MGTRERILQAARQVLESVGPARTTTREIARAAGLSEGALYKHFASKEELLLAILKESPSDFVAMVEGLPGRAGSGSVRDNLRAVGLTAVAFYRESLPLGALLLTDPGLLERSRKLFAARGAGPQNAVRALTRYIAVEQKLGRIAGKAAPESVASLFLGACFQKAYLMMIAGGEERAEEVERFVDGLLATLEPALRG